MSKNKKAVNKSVNKPAFSFPASLLAPIGNFLSARLHILQKTKKTIEKDDPFHDGARLLDNASPDADAAEQFGHAKTDAIKGELEKKIKQVQRALERLNKGKYGLCEDCGQMIDTERLSIYPEATFCAKCQTKREK
jgi:RNA polymerase-binding transcription factor DksA